MTEAERAIQTAPKGKLRIVHIDPRDHWPTREGDYDNADQVRASLSGMMHAQQEVMHVFNDQGNEIHI